MVPSEQSFSDKAQEKPSGVLHKAYVVKQAKR
jgi:hypothetical protein